LLLYSFLVMEDLGNKCQREKEKSFGSSNIFHKRKLCGSIMEILCYVTSEIYWIAAGKTGR